MDVFDIYFQLREYVDTGTAELLTLVWIIAIAMAALSALLGAVAAIAYLIAGNRINKKRGEVKP